MFKRISLFLLTNILVVVTIAIVTSILGVNRYITESGLDYTSLLVFSFIVGFTGAIFSLLISRWSAKRLMGVRVLHANDATLSAEERHLVQMVYRLCEKAGMKVMPEVGIYDSPEVNAFATGPSKNKSLVAVSSGLLQTMDDDAIEGVLAHEVAHIVNGDMVTMTLLQGIMNTFVVFLSRVISYAVSQFAREEVAWIVQFVTMIVLDILLSFLGSLVVFAHSRHREFHADAGGAKLAGRNKMVHALRSLQQTVELVDTSDKQVAAFKISGGKNILRLFSTHPPLEDRIARLEQNI
ncbi:MAG TPA: protease HtpX [Massilibacterium sp.]|nr:protease HtpX [Massilibacterium sp.]